MSYIEQNLVPGERCSISEYSTQRTAFVVREMQGGALEVLLGTQVPLVVGDSAPEISKKLVAALQK